MTGTGRTAHFEVAAMAEPGVLIRILELYALRDLVPHRVRSRIVGDRLLIEVEVAEVDDGEAERIAAKIRANVLVTSVRLQQMELRRVA